MFLDSIVQAQKAFAEKLMTDTLVPSQARVWDFWTQVSREQAARLGRVSEHVAEAETLATGRARDAIDESARLARESLDYVTVLTNELRQVTLSWAKPAEVEKA